MLDTMQSYTTPPAPCYFRPTTITLSRKLEIRLVGHIEGGDMNFLILETNDEVELRYDCNGVDALQDIIGNTGALRDGRVTWDEERGRYLITREEYNYWVDEVDTLEAIDEAIGSIKDLATELDYDDEQTDALLLPVYNADDSAEQLSAAQAVLTELGLEARE